MGMDLRQWKRFFTDLPRLDALIGRVSASSRRPIFMVGSGMSLPERPGGPGVPGAAGMVELVRNRLSDDEAALDALNRRLERAEQEVASIYGAAFELLAQWRGSDAVNAVVSDAVRMARLPEARQSDDAIVLEQDVEGWALTRGTSALGFLLAGNRQRYPEATVLTTNFDPLLSIAIKRAHGLPRRVILDGDGWLPTDAEGEPNETPVIHLHGYWRSSDTHHTGMELTAERPQLGVSLARLLNERLVVVVGYEGWDDAFMRAVSSLLADPGARPDIVWAVYDDDPGKLFDRHAALMDYFEKWRFRPRFTLYAGIDANEFFPRLLDRPIASRGPVGSLSHLPVPALADRMHESAMLFDGFIREYAAERKVPGDSRTRLLAQLVDLEDALGQLSDAELKTWPDKEFVVLARTPRNRAREQMERLQQALIRNVDPRAELHTLVLALAEIRDLIRVRVPV
jgi:hypothetical protein